MMYGINHIRNWCEIDLLWKLTEMAGWIAKVQILGTL